MRQQLGSVLVALAVSCGLIACLLRTPAITGAGESDRRAARQAVALAAAPPATDSATSAAGLIPDALTSFLAEAAARSPGEVDLGHLLVLDVSDPEHVAPLGTYGARLGLLQGVAVDGDRAYLVDYEGRL